MDQWQRKEEKGNANSEFGELKELQENLCAKSEVSVILLHITSQKKDVSI